MSISIPQTEVVEISKLTVDGDNPNRMTPKQLERLKSSITKYGFIVPIITNKDYLIADGEQRYIAAKQTGRRCYMMEIDPRYCQVIIDRWEAYTGQHAQKLN